MSRTQPRRSARRAASWSAALLAAGWVAGCGDTPASDQNPAAPEPQGVTWFADVTAQRGPDFHQTIDRPADYFMPDHIGSGVALFDYDNDGRLDLYLLQNSPESGKSNKLFHQQPDGRFQDVTEGSGTGLVERGMGVAAGDANNDGFVDLVVTSYIGVRVLLNEQGSGKFRDVTEASGVSTPHWPTSAIFADFDRDGWLDLVVANYVLYNPSNHCTGFDGVIDYCGPAPFPATRTQIFRNLGDAQVPRFERRTEASGLAVVESAGLALYAIDFDADGWKDLLVSNDARPNHLWINQRDFTFKEEGIARGIGYNAAGMPQGNMGIAVGDVDRNGLFDIYITHLTDEGNVLWAAEGPGLFRDATAGASLATLAWRGTGFGTSMPDLNNDGWPDLAVTNGRITRLKTARVTPDVVDRVGEFWAPYAERNHLFINENGRFRDISPLETAFCRYPNVGRSLGTGDLDNDGGVDLLVTTWGAAAAYYRNVLADRGNWLTIRAVDPALGGRDAYGATVSVMTGDIKHVATVNPGYGYLTSNDPRAHVGLADAARYDSVRIDWPDGSAELFAGGPANQILTLVKGSGSPPPAP